MSLGVGQEQEHPAREDQIVRAARQRRVDEIAFPDRALAESVAAASVPKRVRKRVRSLDGVDGALTRRRSSMCSEP